MKRFCSKTITNVIKSSKSRLVVLANKLKIFLVLFAGTTGAVIFQLSLSMSLSRKRVVVTLDSVEGREF